MLAIPDYAYALLSINKLSLEIVEIELLPNANVDQNGLPQAYNLDGFMDKVYYLTKESENLMKRYFIFIKYIISEVREAYFEKLRFYQNVLNQEDIV